MYDGGGVQSLDVHKLTVDFVQHGFCLALTLDIGAAGSAACIFVAHHQTVTR